MVTPAGIGLWNVSIPSFIHDYNHQANTPTPMNGPTPRGPSPYIINTPPPAPVQEQEVQPTPLFQQPTTRPLEHLMMNPQQSVLFFAYNDNFIHVSSSDLNGTN